VPCGSPRLVHANGVALQAYQWGAPGGSPALLLHSLAAHSHWWDWAAPLLAERFHVVALDLRGHGGSAWVEPPSYRFTDYVADIAAALEALGWRAPLVIGHSMGSYLGAYLAARHPARVGALVIADMLTSWSEALNAYAQAQAARPRAEFASPAEAGKRFRLAPPDTRAPAEWLQHLGETGVQERAPGVWTRVFDPQVFLHPPIDPWPFLPQVAAPTLVVRGQGSVVMDRAAWQRVAMAVRRGQFAELPSAYHHLVLDDPPGFVAIVTKWLAGAQKETSP